jgi:hypothetical protein
VGWAWTSIAVAADKVDFLRDVRPILSSHRFKCHGPDENTRKSGLRLDVGDSALQPAKSGELAIVPAKPESSELVRRIFSTDEDSVMPPPSTKHPLSAAQKQVLKSWIADGAVYTPHWAFEAPRQLALPEVRNPDWPRNGIDWFVLARLEKEGLKPSEPADKFTLARRLHLDLTGLPPTPAQMDAFLEDSAPDAYERLVDTLLASPHYGERWARRWLDLARYADTNGYEKDRPRSMWPYRDWVIQAFNADMPFDQFTLEQIAGDMLPNATLEQKIATGLHRNTMINEEGGIDPLEYRFYSMVDRVHVTSTAWLGLTMACAQCHTHKYDPIQHTEYYQFLVLLNNADEPTLDVTKPDITRRRAEAEAKIASLEAALIHEFPVVTRAEWWTPAQVEYSSENGSEAELLPDGSIRVGGPEPDKDNYVLEFETSLARITHLQLEAIPDERVGQGGPGRTPHGNFVLNEIEMQVKAGAESGEWKTVKFSEAEADFSQDQFPARNAIDGKREGGWAAGTQADKRLHRRLIVKLAEALPLDRDATFKVRLIQQFGSKHTLGRFRIALGTERNDPRPIEAQRVEHRDRKFAQWLQSEASKAVSWQRLRPDTATSPTPTLTIESDDSIFASGDFTKSDTYTLTFQNVPAGVKAIRVEALADDRLPRRGPGTVHYEGPEGDFWLSTLKVSAAGKDIGLKNATESYASGGSTAARAIDDDLQSGWSVNGGQGRSHSAVFQFSEPLTATGELKVDLTFERYYAAALGRLRLSVTTEDSARASGLSEKAYAALQAHRDGEGLKRLRESSELADERETLLREFVKVAPELASKRREIDKMRNDMPKHPTTLVMKERAPGHERATHRHHRGEFLQPKERVSPGVPSFLPPLSAQMPPNRLGLARWLVSPENPLTARVVMNRQWEAFFGRGLVRTLEDFGFQGELPSHPELLDWLALEFSKQGWSFKRMHKLIVLSATYRQSSRVSSEGLQRDPQNILLSRGPRFRVDAESIRDAALVASGLFSPKLGGPSVYPPQPAGVSTDGAYGALEWRTSQGPDRYRRGLYTFAKRTTPYAMTATFDGPSGEACLARRDRSNTPLQALTLLNDSFVMECATALGRWAALEQGSAGAGVVIERMFRRCLTRAPRPDELDRLVSFHEKQLARFSSGELNAGEILGDSDGEQKNETAAWTTVARVLLNLDETITKE